jgi:hypothetical protein
VCCTHRHLQPKQLNEGGGRQSTPPLGGCAHSGGLLSRALSHQINQIGGFLSRRPINKLRPSVSISGASGWLTHRNVLTWRNTLRRTLCADRLPPDDVFSLAKQTHRQQTAITALSDKSKKLQTSKRQSRRRLFDQRDGLDGGSGGRLDDSSSTGLHLFFHSKCSLLQFEPPQKNTKSLRWDLPTKDPAEEKRWRRMERTHRLH